MKPMLFSAEMVRAIQEDRKTVTRRLIRPMLPDGVRTLFPVQRKNGTLWRSEGEDIWCEVKPPHHPGDILWVRETWAHPSIAEIAAGADPNMYLYKADVMQPAAWDKWLPSIHMPKEAARLFLHVKAVRAERLRDIDKHWDNYKREGVVPLDAVIPNSSWYERFIYLWNSTIKPSELPLYGWEANPWVWVIEFERISKEAALGGGGDG